MAEQRTKGLTQPATLAIALISMIAITVIPVALYMPTASRLETPLFAPRVCTFYYTWWGNETVYPNEYPTTANRTMHWDENVVGFNATEDPYNIGATNHPTLGTDDIVLYDSADPLAIRYHLDQAVAAGIDTFIATWWGPDNYIDRNFELLLNETLHGNYSMDHTIYFESVQPRYDASQLPAENVTRNIAEDLEYVIVEYAGHTNFLHVTDPTTGAARPVIFLYAVTSLRKTAAIWQGAIAILAAKGLHPFLIADVGNPRALPRGFEVFDGVHVYNPLGIYRDEPARALDRFETMVLSSRVNGLLAAATVLPGYDDTRVRDGVKPLPREDGAVYNASWDVAIASDPDWVLICSFNEWHEGSEIEPSLQDGTRYMELTAVHAARFKA